PLLEAAGSPVFGVELRITDSLGNQVPTGETGEVCARAGNLMREYWNKPDETAEALRDGWYHTGDIGHLDGDGYLYLTDRVNDMIVTGGENVYSTEVEHAIARHPAVQDVAVIGIPSDAWGEAVHAIVVLKEDMRATGEELIEHARRFLAGFKVPKSVEIRSDPLPLSGAFKPLKRELRRPYWEGRERQVG
ncbi:MAG TPA: AMP-dependent synthetase, partial [Acidimicrobiales bacterium]|nr:AMP-dependent synthetase [Acidimicrobiales bacterium]